MSRSEDESLLIRLVKLGKKTQALLDKGTDVNVKDKYGQTVLMNVACWGPKEIVECLINKSADVNAKAKSGETALKLAAYSHNKDVVELLKEHGAKEEGT